MRRIRLSLALLIVLFLAACGGGGTDTPPDTADSSGREQALAVRTVQVKVTVVPAGSGTVVSSPAGLSCSTVCTANFVRGSVATLSATPAIGYAFSGWSGNCTGTATCTLALSGNKKVTATFVKVTYALTATKQGLGTVASTPAGISCGAICSARFDAGATVALSATPGAGYQFTGWSGACTGVGSCSVLMGADTSVAATFTAAPPPTYDLTVTIEGSGAVYSTPAGIACGATCSASFDSGAVVALTPGASSGYSFSAWGGACAGSGACSVTMSQTRLVTATFVLGGSGDTTPPTIATTSPANGATGVSVTNPIAVTFSELVDCNTVTTASFTVTAAAGTVACSGASAVFTPSTALAYSTAYTVQIAGGVKDLAGNALGTPTSWGFTTASQPAGGGNFTFLAYGDTRGGTCDGNQVHLGLVQRMVAEPAQFVFNLGDMVTGFAPITNWVQRGDCPLDASRGSFKEIIAPLQSKTPAAGLPTFYFPVVGNHDDGWGDGWYPDAFGNGFCSVFNPQSLVQNHTQHFEYFKDTTARVTHFTDGDFYSRACSTTDLNNGVYSDYIYYSFRFQNSVFAVLKINTDSHDLMVCNNCSADQSNYDDYYNKHQLDWLRYVLTQANADPSVDNIFVFLHAPLVTSGDSHPPNASWPVLLKEFSQYNSKMKIVFSGHNHVYERSYPVFASDAFPNGVRDDIKGTVYAVSGGGGSRLDGFNDTQPLIAKKSASFHYMRIDVNGKAVSVQAIGLDGVPIDSFTR